MHHEYNAQIATSECRPILEDWRLLAQLSILSHFKYYDDDYKEFILKISLSRVIILILDLKKIDKKSRYSKKLKYLIIQKMYSQTHTADGVAQINSPVLCFHSPGLSIRASSVLSAETMSCSTIYQNSKTKGPIHS